MVNVTQLLFLDVAALEDFADRWGAIYRKMEEVKQLFHGAVAAPLAKGAWKGLDGAYAARHCTRIDRDIEDVALEVKAVKRFVGEEVSGESGGKGLRRLQNGLIEVQNKALNLGLTVEADGKVTWSQYRPPGKVSDEEKIKDQENKQNAEKLEQEVAAILKEATAIDQAMQRHLAVAFGTTQNFETEDRRYGIVPVTLPDLSLMTQLSNVSFGLRHGKGWNNAADLLDHYMGNTGKPYTVNPTQMMHDIPKFQKDVNTEIEHVRSRPDGKFATDWKSTAPNPKDGKGSMDWYYGLNHFQYRTVGVKENGKIEYHVEVKKRYDWGSPSEQRSTVSGGGYTMEQADIAHLHSSGQARDFDVKGKSSKISTTA